MKKSYEQINGQVLMDVSANMTNRKKLDVN